MRKCHFEENKYDVSITLHIYNFYTLQYYIVQFSYFFNISFRHQKFIFRIIFVRLSSRSRKTFYGRMITNYYYTQ